MRRWLIWAGLLCGAGCGPTARDIENAQIHYDLGVNAMETAHDAPSALRELQMAVQANPGMADAHKALGLIYHMMLHKPEEAVAEYQTALKLEPKDSEAANNLGAVFIELGRYGEAAAMFERALSNDLYRTPFFARGNLGWALYKQGDIPGGISNLKAAVQMNADYCQGYRSLGMIASDQGQADEALAEFSAFEKHCPKEPEAAYREGMVLLKKGDQDRAREDFKKCEGDQGNYGAECARMLKMMQQ